MRVVLNGEAREVADGLTVAGLLSVLGLQVGSVVVERNGEVVLRSDAASTPVQAGDVLEVVKAVAGG